MNEPGDQNGQEQGETDPARAAQSNVLAPADTKAGKQKHEAGKEGRRLPEKLAGFSPLFEFLVAVCAFVGLVLVGIQIYYMGESNRLTRESNELTARALVISQRAEVGVEKVGTVQLSRNGQPLLVRVTIRNTGNTSATKMKVVSGAAYLPDPISPGFQIADKGKVILPSNGTLPAGGTLEIPIDIPNLADDALAMVLRKEAFLYSFGEIIYLDGFGNKRETRFCAQHEAGQWGQCPNNNEVE